MKNSKRCLELVGSLWFQKSGQRFLDGERIDLLERIDEIGSIVKAATAAGISYKTAWDRINLINSLADKPLVERITGGLGGGGTTLTAYGKRIIRQFRAVEEEHRKFLDSMEKIHTAGDSLVLCTGLLSLDAAGGGLPACSVDKHEKKASMVATRSISKRGTKLPVILTTSKNHVPGSKQGRAG